MNFNSSNGRFSEKSIGRVLTGIAFLYQAIAVVVVVWALVVAAQWIREPFLGSFYEHTLVFTDPAADSTGVWAFNKIVNSGDQLIAINGTDVKNSRDVREVLSSFVPGENVTATVKFKNGETRDLSVELQRFPEDAVSIYLILPSIISFVFLVLSIWTFGLRRNEPSGRAFALFASSFAIVTGTIFNLWTSHEFTTIWTAAVAIAGGANIALALSFPTSPRFIINRPYLRWVGFILSFVLTAITIPYLFNSQNPTEYIAKWQNLYYFAAV
ncbi:MAG TPA: hypothetical protein PLQ75_01395, partial [Anaerolineales bacterium]|nr:hypothetical protein [Anaerolineales bacterium]